MKLPFLRQSTAERRDLILNGPMDRTLMTLAAPGLMLGLVQSMMPLADGLFINNVEGPLVASAVSFSEPVINLVSAMAMGLSVAAMAMLGQLNGSGDFDGSRKASTQIVAVGSVLGLLGAPLLALSGAAISTRVDPRIAANVLLYLSLYAFVLPFSFMESIYNGIKNASGHPEAPFIRMVLMLVLKVIFNAVFIAWLRMGIVGCALASFGANFLITLWMFHELFVKRGPDRLDLKGFRFDPALVRELMRVGFPAMLNSAMLNLGFFLINTELAKYGPVVINGQGIATSISQICYILPGSFSSSITAMVGMNIGAGNPAKARAAFYRGLTMSFATAVAIMAVIIPLAPRLTLLYTRRPEVLAIANEALSISTFSVVGFAATICTQGAFVGLGRTRVPLVLGLFRIWLLRYAFILVTERWLGHSAVFWGNLFSNYAAGGIALFLISRATWVSALRRTPAVGAGAGAATVPIAASGTAAPEPAAASGASVSAASPTSRPRWTRR